MCVVVGERMVDEMTGRVRDGERVERIVRDVELIGDGCGVGGVVC